MNDRMTSRLKEMLFGASNHIDARLSFEMGRGALARFGVHTKALPHYRFVDLYRAVEEFCRGRADVTVIEAEHDEDLNEILHAKRRKWISRRIKPSRRTAWPIGPDDEIYLPVDTFWLCKTPESGTDDDRFILRIRYDEARAKALIEIASPAPAAGEIGRASCRERV